MSQQQLRLGASETGGSAAGDEEMSDGIALKQALEAMRLELAQLRAKSEAQSQATPPQIFLPPNFFAEIAGMNTSNIVPRYSGERGDSLIRWLKEYKSQAGSLGWDNTIKMRRLGAHLEGRAREVFEDAQRAAGANFSFEQAEAALTNAFAKGFWQDAARARLQSRVQRKGEAVFAFYRDLCDEAEIAYGDLPAESRSRTLLSLFINGLRPNIRSFVFANNPRNEKEAIDFAVKCENAPFLAEHAVESPTVAHVVAGVNEVPELRAELNSLRSQVTELVHQLTSLSRVVAQLQGAPAAAPQAKGDPRHDIKFPQEPKPFTTRGEIRCYNCHQIGHYSNSCRAPRAGRNGGDSTRPETRRIASVQVPAGDSRNEAEAYEDDEDYPMLGAEFLNRARAGDFTESQY